MSAELHQEISACQICADHLPHGPRPVVQFSSTARLLIIGQAPGTKVHASGIPWDDDSGDRLREWLGVDKTTFYNPDKIALMPMGFCYPGKAQGGDAPPRKECAPRWHDRVLGTLPKDRLTLLVGTYAQEYYLPHTKKMSMTARVQGWRDYSPEIIPLPHPAWRSAIWMKKNPWFTSEVLPDLRRRVFDTMRS
ncbi:uracil-DNA glycosylase family protein [Erythrobacter sp. W53]|uniref:uracil-DNA glycosylase family protein n=1 Tax=Erythrobacter sp. W53 TaxID=3425947 RepID=UPI003D76A05A